MKREQPSQCSGCTSEDWWLLHNVRHRGIYGRLCTSCVLKFHPGSFCPICFEFYEGSLPPHERVSCLKCSSLSHLACVGLDIAPRFVCPTCVNPSLLFFNIETSNKKSKCDDAEQVPTAEIRRSIDPKSAKVLLTAARIASVSMNKAASAAKVESKRRAKEAVLAKKRAKEALDRVVSLVAKEKEVEEEEEERAKESRGTLDFVSVAEQKKKSIASSAVDAAVATEKPPNVVPKLPKNGVNVEEKDPLRVSHAPDTELRQIQNPDSVNEKEIPHLQNHRVTGEDDKGSTGSMYSGTLQLTHSNEDTLVSKNNSGFIPAGSVDTAC